MSKCKIYFTVSNTIPLDENSNNNILLSATKLWIVIGCISALVFIAIIQAGCTIYKTARRPRPNHKVILSAYIFLLSNSDTS